MRWSRWIGVALVWSLLFFASPAFAQAVACTFGVADVARPPNPSGEEKVILSQSNPEYIDNEPKVMLNFDEGTYTNFAGTGDGDTYPMQYLKFKDAYMMFAPLPEKVQINDQNVQVTIVYFPGSKTAVEVLRHFAEGELDLARAGKSPHLDRKEALARIDPSLRIEIAPCRDATPEEIKKAATLGPPDTAASD